MKRRHVGILTLLLAALIQTHALAQNVRRQFSVATVADLYLASPADDDVYTTRGYSQEGVGGNTYRYDASAVTAVDYGYVLDGRGGNGSGTGTGRFIAVTLNEIRATQYGVLPSGDSTVAFGRAVDAAMARGLPLLVDLPTVSLATWTAKTTTASLTIRSTYSTPATLTGPGGAIDLLTLSAGDTAVIDHVRFASFRYVANQGGADLALLRAGVNIVPTAASLYAQEYARDNEVYRTLGYSTEGIGGNTYRYDASSSATVDYGFVIDGPGGNGTGSGTGRFIALDQSVVDVTQFGAIGNGVAVDTTAVTRAVTALVDNATLKFPPGTYLCTDITIPPGTTGVHIVGYGAVLKAHTATTLCLILADDTTVEGLHVNGNAIADYGIYIGDGVSGCRITWCIVGNVAGSTAVGIAVEGDGADYTVIENNRVYDVIGSSVGRGIRFSGNTTPATPVRGCKIVDNIITNVEPVADADGIVVQDWTAVVDVLVSGNTITECDKRAIKIQSPGVTITENKIVIPGTTAYGGIDVQVGNCEVLGNTIYGAADAIISLGSSLGDDANICSGNKITIPSGHGASSVDAIVTEGTSVSNVLISGNIITAGSAIRSFISLEGEGTSTVITENLFSGPLSGGSNAIYTGYTSPASSTDNVKIINNRFEGVTGEYLLSDLAQSTTGVEWTDNTSDGAEIGITGSTTIGIIVNTSGTGTPESAVRGGIGSVFRRKDGGAGTTLYVKESGTGTTGWVGK